MGKIKIRLFRDGTVQMETEGIKGKRCADYAKVLERLADVKIDKLQTTSEYYEQEIIQQQDIQRLKDGN